MGFIGGRLGYSILRRISPKGKRVGSESKNPYETASKLDLFYPKEFWDNIADKVVVDFGCGYGIEAIEMAKRGAKHVIGIDILQAQLDAAKEQAVKEGVGDRCTFTQEWDGKADTVVSNDAFEHFEDPGFILELMSNLIGEDGVAWFSFGPPWYHPLGGHLFSVFPWAHLLFTEASLIRWRSDFKSDGATRFSEVEGGLNQMTIRRFKKVVAKSPFFLEKLEFVPINRLRFLSNPLTREFLTSCVRGRMKLRSPEQSKD